MDGLGNDFVIIDRMDDKVSLSKDQIIKWGIEKYWFDQIIFLEKN